jgi:hypothetical protein
MARKIFEGLSVRVTVPQNTTVNQGDFARFDGILGVAADRVVTGSGQTKPLVLDIEPAQYETDQIDSADTFPVGSAVFWDNIEKRLTTVDTDGTYCGRVTKAKDSNGVIWFLFQPDQYGVAGQAAAVTDITTADGSDAATTQALANATKAKVNALLASLRAAGILAS